MRLVVQVEHILRVHAVTNHGVRRRSDALVVLMRLGKVVGIINLLTRITLALAQDIDNALFLKRAH